MDTEIRKLQLQTEAEWCARVMAESEPWVTLRRTYEDSLKIVTDPSKEVYLASRDGELAGFIILNMKGAFIGYVQTICIAPELRGKGIGTTLLGYAEQRIFSEGPNVFMCVSTFNQDAKRLYERLGYETIGELKEYLIRGHSEVLLRKTLGPLIEFSRKP